ncbi:MAG: bifunctional response regulator/alkaline phosphatase family protein [Candidatus Eisenbacteria bacterium]|nr:bifunctional response regulator/alkaline phosphatase family protein [Candidatus Eisenbacteria bacterium]
MAEAARKILWVDDEIELLKSHIVFLEEKGYSVTPVSNGEDAISRVNDERFDVVLLDEMMPGLGGIETLEKIRVIDPGIPVVMITKSEEEELMDEAIVRSIDDHLIKPVNPIQIYFACRKILEAKTIREEQVRKEYVEELGKLQAERFKPLDWDQWTKLYSGFVRWELALERIGDSGFKQIHTDQIKESNIEFARYIVENYKSWIHGAPRPALSVDIIPKFVVPHLKSGKRVYFIVIDCMRLDQCLSILPLLEPYYETKTDYCYSILPSATPYSRNAIFSGLYPSDLRTQYPDMWQEIGTEDTSKNKYEKVFLEKQLERLRVRLTNPLKYVKIFSLEEGHSIRKQIASYSQLQFVAFVFNFVDILAHGRSESEILQELAPDEAAFRSIMKAWFTHSSLFDILKLMAQQKAVVVLTTDHGSVLGRRAALVLGNRDTSTNLRYKYGNNLGCDEKQALLIKKPEEYRLPADALNKNYIIAKEDYYFVYPTRFHEYERQYRGSFQHGGISMEEMILPCLTMEPRT